MAGSRISSTTHLSPIYLLCSQNENLVLLKFGGSRHSLLTTEGEMHLWVDFEGEFKENDV